MADEEPLTEEELDEIDARAAAATPGPWEAFVEGRNALGGDDFIRTGGLDDACPDVYVQHVPWRIPVKTAPPADLDFIAWARQDIPRLVREVRRLRRLLSDRGRGARSLQPGSSC